MKFGCALIVSLAIGQTFAYTVADMVALKAKFEGQTMEELSDPNWFKPRFQQSKTPQELNDLMYECGFRMGAYITKVSCDGSPQAVTYMKSVVIPQAVSEMEQVSAASKNLPSEQKQIYDAQDKLNQQAAAILKQMSEIQLQQAIAGLAQTMATQPQPMAFNSTMSQQKRIRSVGHCAIHGDFELALGCPGCKGNVDYGSGKQMHCYKHGINYDSKYGCPRCSSRW